MAYVISQELINAALQMQASYGLPASAALAQCIQESAVDGIAAQTSLARNAKNCLGIEGKGPAGSYGIYKKFHNFSECFMDYGRFMSGSTYAAARAKLPNVEAYIRAYAHKYATDPNYANDVVSIWKKAGLSKYDTNASTASVPVSTADVVTYAKQELDARGYQDYDGYKYSGRHGAAWCQFFASWCGGQAGLSGSITPPTGTGGTDAGKEWFVKHGHYATKESGYIPQRNDFIYYKRSASHVGIVTDCDGTYVYTIEGNLGASKGHHQIKAAKLKIGGGSDKSFSWAHVDGFGKVHDYITSASTDLPAASEYIDIPDNKSSWEVSTRTVDSDLATIQVIMYPAITGSMYNTETQKVEVTDQNGWMEYCPKIWYRKTTDTEAQSFMSPEVGFEPAGSNTFKSWYLFLDALEPNTEYTYTVQMYWKNAASTDWALGGLPAQTFTFKTLADDDAETEITLEMQLYPAGETKFIGSGLGGLPDAESAVVSETINGEYELVVEYPSSGANFDQIQIGRIITARPQPSKEIEPFRIANIEQDIDGRATITCQHVSYDFSYTECSTFAAGSVDEGIYKLRHRASTLNSNIPKRLRIDDYSGKNPSLQYRHTKIESLRAALYDFVDAAGYEIGWRRWHAYLYEKRGTKTDYRVDYGHNLKDCNLTVDFSEYYTAVNTIYTKTDTVTLNSGTDREESVEQSSSIFGTEIDKTAESAFPYKRLYLYDISSKFQGNSDESGAPSVEQMDELRDNWIDAHGLNVPAITLEASFIDLADTYDYDGMPHDSVNIGDRCLVNCQDIGFTVNARVIKTEYDVLNHRYNTLTIGNADNSIASTISNPAAEIREKITADQAKNLADKYSAEKMRQDLAMKLAEKNGLYMTTQTGSDGGSIFYLHDKPDLASSTIVWKMTRDAFGVSTDGGKTWNAGLTVDGNLIAKILTATGVNADWIRTGNIQDKTGNNYWNLDTGEMHITAEAPDETIQKIETEYYLSTSTTEQKDGAWSEDQPEWTSGKYIWSRIKYTHKDTSATYSAPVLMRMINGAYEDVSGLDEKQTKALKDATTQQAIFNALTNGDNTQGIFMKDGKLYLNGAYIEGQTVAADNVLLYGNMYVYTDSSGSTVGGWLGYGLGQSSYGSTKGMHLLSSNGKAELIATTDGARLSYGNNSDSNANSNIYATDAGAYIKKSGNGLSVGSGGSSFDGPLSLDGYTSINGGLTVDNATTYIKSGLDVIGGSTIRSALKVNSADDKATYAEIGSSGINFNNTVNVNSPSALNANGGLNVRNGAEIRNSLSVTDGSTVFFHAGSDGNSLVLGNTKIYMTSTGAAMAYDITDDASPRVYVSAGQAEMKAGDHTVTVKSTGIYLDGELYDGTARFG